MRSKNTMFIGVLTLSLSATGAFAAVSPLGTSYTVKNYGIHHAKGLKQTARGDRFMKTAPKRSFLSATETVPSTYTLRGQAGPVEDQGQCGSCWDFSLTSVLRGTWIMSGKDPGRLSFNYLLNCATEMQGCDGGYFDAANHFVSPAGAPAYGSDGDYTAGDTGEAGTCEQETAVASAASYQLLGTNFGRNPSGVTPSFQDVAYVVGVLHQPVSIDIDASSGDWESYSSGVYNGCAFSSLDHMVSLEGYDCETSVDANGNCVFDANGNLPPGVGTYLIRNSWGTSWGDSGYITMKATDSTGAACQGVATDALYYDLLPSQIAFLK